MYSANETYYWGTQSSIATCYCLCRVTHSKGDRLSVERKKKYFAAEHLGYCGGTYQALRGGKNRLYIQSRLWSAFLRRIFMVCILAAEISDEYCKS